MGVRTLFLFALSLVLLPLSLFADGYPKRIVCLAPSITENLCQLGARESIAGVTLYCPSDMKDKQLVGTVLEPNIEKIYSLSPDLVIATKEGNKKETVEKLRELKIRVLVLESEKDFEGICANFIIMGKLVGRERQAEEIINSSKKRLEAVRKKANALEPVRVFWEIGTNPLFTVGDNNFVNDYNSYIGANNIFANIGAGRYPQVSREEVIKRNPDAILLVTMAGVSDGEIKLWEQFKTLRAVINKEIFIVDGKTLFLPTPETFVSGVESIFKLLHHAE
jgi:iron complex transport system substrate-binding protein